MLNETTSFEKKRSGICYSLGNYVHLPDRTLWQHRHQQIHWQNLRSSAGGSHILYLPDELLKAEIVLAAGQVGIFRHERCDQRRAAISKPLLKHEGRPVH